MLGREDDKVKRLRTEHASLEEKNTFLRNQEEYLEAKREAEHHVYLQALARSTRQMYAGRQALSDAVKTPELVDEARMLISSFEEDCIGKLIHNDAFDMIRYGLASGFEKTANAHTDIVCRLGTELPSGG